MVELSRLERIETEIARRKAIPLPKLPKAPPVSFPKVVELGETLEEQKAKVRRFWERKLQEQKKEAESWRVQRAEIIVEEARREKQYQWVSKRIIDPIIQILAAPPRGGRELLAKLPETPEMQATAIKGIKYKDIAKYTPLLQPGYQVAKLLWGKGVGELTTGTVLAKAEATFRAMFPKGTISRPPISRPTPTPLKSLHQAHPWLKTHPYLSTIAATLAEIAVDPYLADLFKLGPVAVTRFVSLAKSKGIPLATKNIPKLKSLYKDFERTIAKPMVVGEPTPEILKAGFAGVPELPKKPFKPKVKPVIPPKPPPIPEVPPKIIPKPSEVPPVPEISPELAEEVEVAKRFIRGEWKPRIEVEGMERLKSAISEEIKTGRNLNELAKAIRVSKDLTSIDKTTFLSGIATRKQLLKKVIIRTEEVAKLAEKTEEAQAKLLSINQKEAIARLHNISKPSEMVAFYKRLENQSWIKAIERLREEKQLSQMTVSRIKKALQIGNIKKTEQPALAELYDFMIKLEKGDQLLSPKQVGALSGILKNIDRIDLLPKRVIMNEFGEKVGLLEKGIMGKVANQLVPTVNIKEGHKWVEHIVDKAEDLLHLGRRSGVRRMENFEKLISAAEKSRPVSLKAKAKRLVAPTNPEMFRALSGLSVKLTKEETAVVAYLKNFFKKAKGDLALKKYRKDYVTHIKRDVWEKMWDEGILSVLKKESIKDPNIPVQIMEELDNIIGSEKFFRFALERKGGIVPTQNLRRILSEYSELYEAKLALDKVLPEAIAIKELLLQPKTRLWVHRSLQNLKGRGLDMEFRRGKMGWLANMADTVIDLSYIKLLGLNYWSMIKNIIGGEVNSISSQLFHRYALGKLRFLASPKKAYGMLKDLGFTEGMFYQYATKGAGLKKMRAIERLPMAGQWAGEVEIRGSLMLSELTAKEWASGAIPLTTRRRIYNRIARTQGIFTPLETPLLLQTVPGRAIMQMNRWRITNTALAARTARQAVSDFRTGKVASPAVRNLFKMIILYGLGMYTSYELGKAGFKRSARVAQTMAETLNNIIEFVSTDMLLRMIRENPTLSFMDEALFSFQELTSQIVPGVDPPNPLKFRKGLEDTFISLYERPKELLEEVTKWQAGEPTVELRPSVIPRPPQTRLQRIEREIRLRKIDAEIERRKAIGE